MRFWTFVISLLACCGALVGGMLLMLRTVGPVPPGLSIFSMPDGSPCHGPCMFGIQVGETTFDDAVKLLESHPLTRDLVKSESLGRNGVIFQGRNVGIGLSRDARGRLSLIDFLIESQLARNPEGTLPENTVLEHLKFGDIVSTLGPPDYIEFTSSGIGRTLRTYYQGSNLQIVIQQDPNPRLSETRLSERDPLIYIFMYPQPLDIRPGMNHWEGFTAFLRYLDAEFRP